MVIALTGLPLNHIARCLEVLSGLVEEADKGDADIYLWRTRHEVVARTISRYKFADPEDLESLFDRVIAIANPALYEEVRTLRELCNSDMGIRAIPSIASRVALYHKVVAVLPADRVARHRLVRELIEHGSFGDAEAELKRAVDDVGLDPPLQRYKVKVLLARSRGEDILPEDRQALIRQAHWEAQQGVTRFADSKYMFLALADAAEEWRDATGDDSMVEGAVQELRKAYSQLLDPMLQQRLVRLERT